MVLFVVLSLPAKATAGPIYVYKDAGGVTRFSNKPPPNGIDAKVFTAKRNGFSVYRTIHSPMMRGRLYPSEYKDLINQAALNNNIEASLVQAVIHAESGFNPHAVSRKGALGLMQLMPKVADSLGVTQPFNPNDNISGGVKHLAWLIKKYDGNLRLALAAYNAGSEAVERFKGVPPYAETQAYVRKVIELHSRYKGVKNG